MWERLATLPAPWLRDAELSFSRHDGERLGLQTRLDSAEELAAFLERFSLDRRPFVDADADVRSRFQVSPFRWAKIGFRGGTAVEASQYFLVDPSCHHPISTLRVFARRFGQGHAPILETVLHPALDAPDTRWGLATKPSPVPDRRQAVAFCTIPRPCLTAVLERLAGHGLVPTSRAARLLEATGRLAGRPRVFLTVDLADPSRIAVDVEEPTCLDPVADWLATLAPHAPRYLKCRPAGDDLHWTAYHAWTSLPRTVSAPEALESIRAYYERTHEDYLACVGPTFQAALLAETPEASNLRLAERAGLRAGMRVLDAGCGVCGPALDMARALDITVDGVTLSPSQAETARCRISESGLAHRVRVHLGDFHRLPFEDGAFDAAVLLESASYSPSPEALFSEMHRVLRPGGILYVKDFFRCDAPLGVGDMRALQDYDFTYCTCTRTLGEVMGAVARAGFVDARGGALPGVDMDRFHQAMIDPEPRGTVGSAFLTALAPAPRLSRFGRYHRRSWERLPVDAGEIRAVRFP